MNKTRMPFSIIIDVLFEGSFSLMLLFFLNPIAVFQEKKYILMFLCVILFLTSIFLVGVLLKYIFYSLRIEGMTLIETSVFLTEKRIHISDITKVTTQDYSLANEGPTNPLASISTFLLTVISLISILLTILLNRGRSHGTRMILLTPNFPSVPIKKNILFSIQQLKPDIKFDESVQMIVSKKLAKQLGLEISPRKKDPWYMKVLLGILVIMIIVVVAKLYTSI
ncbi:MAG: hypothetical protein COU32_00825 [Candidatus Magasanikbacteria bacterium CG10_big_fil_rev_8_21_14_0_10_42_10]|uniref:Uncharacterized protein n=2 Tax=Candidatus Magasanikiibacteriota TaxID=1752731 RepID=A0A2H0TX19_9BACT|nr:MAG: hypothetical protein COU32_00825 [Candidatus Magasanikbacteria bacterium CG10_big_fil_rev_8_21_14_0_10_42_10]PIZ92774.1 MAG: hypothetical protein COX82_04030 [Candidatus Magasanikbacteria bacterium CG_4_10_14_0_2_um_filter_41_10]